MLRMNPGHFGNRIDGRWRNSGRLLRGSTLEFPFFALSRMPPKHRSCAQFHRELIFAGSRKKFLDSPVVLVGGTELANVG